MNSPPAAKIHKDKDNENTCARILTPKQMGPLCWFMATFVAMFYSQRSRKKLLDASPSWNNKKALFASLKHVLDDKYLKTKNGRDSEDYKKFRDDTFIKILSYLHLENSKAFPYDPKKVSGGFVPEYYIGKLYKLLNVDYKIFSYFTTDKVLSYSFLNEEYDWLNYTIAKREIIIDINIENVFKDKTRRDYYNDNGYAPPILIVKVSETAGDTSFYKVKDGNTKDSLTSMKEQIFYNGKEYNLDAVILANWNINKKNGHAIAGITCKKGKYVYNGWTRTSMDPVMKNQSIDSDIPCELMKYDWNIVKNNDFCLNTRKCIPELLKKKLKVRDICFNFSKGGKLLIYVCKDVNKNTSSENYADAKKSLSPLSPPKAPKKPKKPKNPNEPKVCPEGKVLNPRTNRCILIKNVKKPLKPPKSPKSPKSPKPTQPKVCPEGKVLNPKTNRCIIDKNVKKPKEPKVCPEGKVLNPKTGRCILKNSATAKKLL
jgi:hypothetical protein|uniref:Uncharacterized protein n=1 Tax=viral metagenome TaxID=1070528 RepID=A0A6C0CEX3_9ZZZZ